MEEGENNPQRRQPQPSRRGFLAGYQGGKEMPLLAYAGLLGLYQGVLASLLVAATKSKRKVSERMGYGDLFRLGVVTYKVSRLIPNFWALH